MEKMTTKNEKQCLQRAEKTPLDEEKGALKGQKTPPPQWKHNFLYFIGPPSPECGAGHERK